MSQQEAVDISITRSATGLANALPLELIDTIVENNRDDKESLLASSNDFMRWRHIGYHLPQVPLHVKVVVFKPERKSVQSLEEVLFLDVRVEEGERFILDNLFVPAVSGILHARNAAVCFDVSFRFLKEVEFRGTFADAKEFLGLLPPIEVLDIIAIVIEEAGSSRQSPVFTGDVANLRKLSVDECRTPLNWLVDDILAMACPTQLQSIRYAHGFPFSPTTFARLVTLSSQSLQELIIQPPDRTTPGGWQIPPHFTNKSFPSLTSLTFCIIQLGLPHKPPLFSMNWCRRTLEDLPPALKMTSLTMHFYAVRPEDTDEIVADQSFDWKQLSEHTSELFPELKKFVIHISMETEFGMRRKALSEALLKERLEHFGNKLVIEWGELLHFGACFYF
ncbi:hypothetical protein EV421DRAFT_1733773 [Armillaria borealis]|uniref:Uncharacterized protein n=1 Tax=Armillaria borealis TaxID=47425 RepID=A0AA39JQT5_9AGAR|nr:hypothetical protein EV421DRAFT_1733773 [Armillaria borealis]